MMISYSESIPLERMYVEWSEIEVFDKKIVVQSVFADFQRNIFRFHDIY